MISRFLNIFLNYLPPLEVANFRLPQAYQAWSGKEKVQFLWGEISNTEYKQMPKWGWLTSGALLWENLKVTISDPQDINPIGRGKPIHTYGAVVPFEFVSTSANPYTGFFEGAENCILRISLATNPKVAGVMPGLALKYLVDRNVSGNVMLMHSLDSQGQNYNVFANTFTNILPPPEKFFIKIFKLLFEKVAKQPLWLGVENLTTHRSNGEICVNPKYPFEMKVEPLISIESDDGVDFRERLKSIPVGTKLYRVLARDQMETKEWIELGEIITKDRFKCSSFGDFRLFFKHQLFEQIKA